uniref:C-type lectin domain-containing protein n=1 Tax=Panagrolaimus superbus TaxID=310955 RepID=A0A914ZGY6_9BILA
MGGHLASIHDGFTNALLTGHSVNIFQGAKDYWIGLSNINTPKKLSWMDGTKLDFVDWDKNQPGKISGIRCTSAELKTGLWKTDSCFLQKSYVCGVPKAAGGSTTMPPMTRTTTRRTSPTTTGSGAGCSGNFTYFAPTNACYGVFNTYDPDATSWNASEALCQSINGHLASIHSADEFTFIMSKYKIY